MKNQSLQPGLVSVTFRTLSPEELVDEAASAGLRGIEWGGDVHVPHGDVAGAKRVGALTREAGLEVAAYGSYYRLGESGDNPEFQAVLDSAQALGAPTIRVWAGRKGSADADEAAWRRVTEDARRVCGLAAAEGVRICLEHHGGTLTDTIDSSTALLEALPLDNLDSLWQAPHGKSDNHCEASLRAVLSRCSNLHVFHWGSRDRHPLAEGTRRWARFFEIATSIPIPRWTLLEFVKGDSLEQFHEDARVLKELLKTGSPATPQPLPRPPSVG